jgi:hypothetical protein
MYIYINHTTGMRLTMLLNIHMQKSTSQQLSLKSPKERTKIRKEDCTPKEGTKFIKEDYTP